MPKFDFVMSHPCISSIPNMLNLYTSKNEQVNYQLNCCLYWYCSYVAFRFCICQGHFWKTGGLIHTLISNKIFQINLKLSFGKSTKMSGNVRESDWCWKWVTWRKLLYLQATEGWYAKACCQSCASKCTTAHDIICSHSSTKSNTPLLISSGCSESVCTV